MTVLAGDEDPQEAICVRCVLDGVPDRSAEDQYYRFFVSVFWIGGTVVVLVLIAAMLAGGYSQ